MENATKALLIAGGILIALIIISAAAMVYMNAREFEEQQNSLKKIEQVQKFNQEYEAYNKKELRGVELITIINKAINYNEKNPDGKIAIEVTMGEKVVFDGLEFGAKYNFTEDSLSVYMDLRADTNRFKIFKEQRFFKCTSIEYKNRDGIISKMTFEEITLEGD